MSNWGSRSTWRVNPINPIDPMIIAMENEIKNLLIRLKEFESKLDEIKVEMTNLSNRIDVLEYAPPNVGGPKYREIEREFNNQIK